MKSRLLHRLCPEFLPYARNTYERFRSCLPLLSFFPLGGLPGSGGLRNSRDLDPAGMLHGLSKIVSRLQAEPRFRATTECLIQADRHLRRDARPAVHDVG